MNEADWLETDLSAGVFSLKLNRPKKLNALTMAMCDQLSEHFRMCERNSDVRCVLVLAEGRAFSAGRDLSDAREGEDAETLLMRHVNPMIQALYDCSKPTISAVNGPAMGIGLGLALACDIVLGSETAVFSSPFAKLGSALDSGGHYFLPRRVGVGRALSMIYTSETVSGVRAYQIGLIDKLILANLLRPAARQLACRIADGPVNAFREQKSILRRSEEGDLADVLTNEAHAQGRLATTQEYAEGLAAFMEKRQANFRAAVEGNHE